MEIKGRGCYMCGEPVKFNDRACGRCGASLMTVCPECGRETFISGNCRYCRTSLYVACPDNACGKSQLPKPDGLCRFCGVKISRGEQA